MLNFNKITFGLAAGENEADQYPDLVRRGFFDEDNIIPEIIDGNKYLILGYEGAGKSLIGEKLLTISEERCNMSCAKHFLADFPFMQFHKILPGVAEVDNKYPLTWSWIILLLLLNQVMEDRNVINCISSENKAVIQRFKDLGLLPTKDLRTLVAHSSKNSFKAMIGKFGYEHEKSTNYEIQFSYIVEVLKDLLKKIAPRAKFFLILDGLDDILSMRDIQYQSIAALIFESNRLNNFFFRNRLQYKIVVLCRTDLFEKLPAPNKNKQRQDSAIDIDWYHDSRDPSNSKLIALANMRAKLSNPECDNVFTQYMPTLNEGGKSTIHFLLDHTRHTPRDFIALLNSIKKYSVSNKLSRADILNGMTDYSKNYFLPEIRDEMIGYLSPGQFDIFLQILGSFREREISISALFAESKDKLDRKDVENILYSLFECSAIGNKFHGKNGGENKYFFRFRNRNYVYSLADTVVVHHGLWKAMGLI